MGEGKKGRVHQSKGDECFCEIVGYVFEVEVGDERIMGLESESTESGDVVRQNLIQLMN
jgi:hypothetical protein